MRKQNRPFHNPPSRGETRSSRGKWGDSTQDTNPKIEAPHEKKLKNKGGDTEIPQRLEEGKS